MTAIRLLERDHMIACDLFRYNMYPFRPFDAVLNISVAGGKA